MRRINKKKIIALILLITVIIIEIVAFRNSTADRVIEMSVKLIDADQELETVAQTWSAISSDNSYYVTLPEYVGDKKVKEYRIISNLSQNNNGTTTNTVNDGESTNTVDNITNTISNNITENTTNENSNSTTENTANGSNNNSNNNTNNITSNEIQENTNSLIENSNTNSTESQISETTKTVKEITANSSTQITTNNKTVTYKPGDRINLTEAEIESNEITITVIYDYKNYNNQKLYYKNISQEIDNRIIRAEGYMPVNSSLDIKKVEENEIEEELDMFLLKNVQFDTAYDIKIKNGNDEYQPETFNEKIKVIINNFEDTENKNYRIVHIKENAEEVQNIEIKNNEVSFKASDFSIYAVLSEPNNSISLYSADDNSNNADIWDGTTASGFEWGEGTQNFPYLISSGAELKYLSDQVNNGNTYENIYFQVARDIDLNNREWTPIGTISNSFRGTFDGAGHVISNGVITITSVPDEEIESYGIFGSIGGGNNKATIKNLELSNIVISIQANGSTGGGRNNLWGIGDNSPNNTEGFQIGILSGTMYRNSQIINCITNNCTITEGGSLTIQDEEFRYAVGGLVGYTQNQVSSTLDPGANSRYEINNCFVNTNINLTAQSDKDTGSGIFNPGTGSEVSDAQYMTGGIIGIIRGQGKWPENSLYVGEINSNGYIGPIFGGLINSTNYNSTGNYASIWNGNNAGNLTMTSYYSGFSANGTTFNVSVPNGTSNNRLSSSSNNIGRVQGVNKGLYASDISSLLANFNNYANNNNLMTWNYENGSYNFNKRFETSVDRSNIPTYVINVENSYSQGPYTYEWYLDGSRVESLENQNQITQDFDRERDYDYYILISDGEYYSVENIYIEIFSIYIEFYMDEQNNVLTGTVSGSATIMVDLSRYSYQWYIVDLAGNEEILEGETSTSLSNIERGQEYKLVATYTPNYTFNLEDSYIYGGRNVIYVSYNGGNDRNDGYSPQTPVRTLSTAYSKLDGNGNRLNNIIVIMGTYSSNSIYNSANGTTYAKNATLTGTYGGVNYNGTLYMYSGDSTYRYLNGDTTFQYLTFYGGRSSLYFYLQGYSLTIGEQVVMDSYTTANSNQGLLGNNAPAVHIICGWLRYNYSTLPRSNAEIIIKSGTYGRIIGGGSPGTTGSSNLQNNTSHNFMGSSMDDCFNINITIDIQNSTTASNYDYDVNLLVGGSACGNNYSRVTENIKSGSVGRLCGGSIGDSSDRPNNWRYPINTFLGEATINISGGSVDELYGGCLGRNMNAIGGGSWWQDDIVCDSYFYGTATINITGGEVLNNIYGAGAGGVTGYSVNSSDEYKSYGQEFDTSVNINISGGTINGDIYGGGYGYTEYLTEDTTQDDAGTLYGESHITITGNPTINENVYGAGCGYNLSSKPNLAQLEGDTTIEISGNPTINGTIYGAGAGLSRYEEMAKLIGTSTVTISSNLTSEVYGGGNNAKVEGSTTININSGTQTGDIYAGGNLGEVVGDTTVNIIGGTPSRVFAGGNQADVTTSVTNITGGNAQEVYGGGNEAVVTNATVYVDGGNTGSIYGGGNRAEVTTPRIYIRNGQVSNVYGGSNVNGEIQQSYVEMTGGEAGSIYGGNNQGGTTTTTNILINGGAVTDSVYGGGNMANTETSNINLNSSDGLITNVFGGGYSADVTTSNVTLNGATCGSIYGGSNTAGTVNVSYVTVESGIAEDVYGGNNQGGQTNTTNVDINEAGQVTNVYGGGDEATTGTTNVNISGTINGNIYGGGNRAGVNTDTHLNIENATIAQSAYGGGNEGTVTGNTYVHVKNSSLSESIYSGGNGSTAIVYGNTNLNIDGTNTYIGKNVFGGGNQAATGSEKNDNSLSTVNIVSGEIHGNVYGGANTSVVYGTTQTNIGFDAVNDTSLERGDLHIYGTVFGGGEANAEGSEIFDFSFISVTQGIDIQINGNGYENFDIDGSIFGSGNASSTSGTSNITIQNYGTADEPKSNISLQRTNCATIINSAIALSGATDRTNEYSDEYYTISRVDRVKLKNNSTLYLNYGANLLTVLESLVDINGAEEKGTVTIDTENNTLTKNVDNRIYMLEGRNLNVATNEQATSYGQVHGMFFLGLFTNRMNPATSTGLYNHNYQDGDEITNAGTFSRNSYVRAQHMDNHDITIDGFYTNYDEEGIINVDYIGVTPPDDSYYIWNVGELADTTVFEFSLSASKYATLGTYELSLMGFSDPNIVFSIVGFSAGLDPDITLVNQDEIEYIAQNEDDANNIFGLTMESGNNGWNNYGETEFLTENGGTYEGDNTYRKDNSTFTPTLNFYLFHSANITEEKLLGDVMIRLQAIVPVDDLNVEIKLIDIVITMTTALYPDDYYEAAITPGEEYSLFTSTPTSITAKSAFSTYYSLYINDFSNSDYYNGINTDYRVLISRDSNNSPYAFPENTRIVMLDLVTNSQYYYVVTSEDVANGKFEYRLSDFKVMGSTDEYFDEAGLTNTYYNQSQDILYESFIFHVKFSEAEIPNDIENNNLLMELRDRNGETLLGVLGIQRDVMRYSVYNNRDAQINITANIDDSNYLGDTINLDVTTDFRQSVVNSVTIYDTEYFEQKMGIMISIYDVDGNRLSLDSLFGINFEIDGTRYYPRLDGTTRIKIADKVSNVLSKIKINTDGNTTLATGTYTIRIESFGSPDGIYFGLESSAMTEVTTTIINSSYGLKVIVNDEYRVIDKDTGLNELGTNLISAHVEYTSALQNPYISVSLYRRKYDDIYSQEYELEDLKDYVSTTLYNSFNENEYEGEREPRRATQINYTLKDNLTSGTYKLVYKLYDGQNYIGEDSEQIIIK